MDSEAAAEGFFAYDCTLQANVLVVPLVLCHLGDSPMHAEISNTTNPSGTLNPCRTCTLTVDSRVAKQTELYVQQFVGIGPFGKPVRPMALWDQPMPFFLSFLVDRVWSFCSFLTGLLAPEELVTHTRAHPRIMAVDQAAQDDYPVL